MNVWMIMMNEKLIMEDDVSSNPQPMSSTGRPRRNHSRNHLRQLEAWNSIQQHFVTQYLDSLAMRLGQLCVLCPNQAQYCWFD